MRNLLINDNSSLLREEQTTLPLKFTNPFFYIPHPLCVEAVAQVQRYIESQPPIKKEADKGKMFGVLIVKTPNDEVGYLAAFSGNLCGSNNHSFFVPPVFDLLDQSGFFKKGEAYISNINNQIKMLENSCEFLEVKTKLQQFKEQSDAQIFLLKQKYKSDKQLRQQHREEIYAKGNCISSADKLLLDQMILQSQFQKAQIKRQEKQTVQHIVTLQRDVDFYISKIEALKQERKIESAKLQFEIFEHFVFANAKGESCTLNEIFKGTAQRIPPAGAGECAAPKLLQYAYSNNLKPIAMAEFWWGESPKSIVRVHGNYYPSCKSKCKPILDFMLQGLDVELSKGEGTSSVCNSEIIEIIFEDDFFMAVNKPSGILSVDGNIQAPSIAHIIKVSHNLDYLPMPVHRLDMDTSGILVLAKRPEFYSQFQRQFANREIHKEYFALLGGILKEDSGVIELPIAPDFEHRPSQMIDFENGKEAITEYEVVERDYRKNITKVKFVPLTGRTHQLRIHSAHKMGLNTPIIGDTLYGGIYAKGLMLHAYKLVFIHPVTNRQITLIKEDNLNF